ncbi:hypothetical protein C8R43DRAFT_1140018 [Mycena crocata]|nr:hypothetical protein C8R43DRAFT_1140018 [Mycena crocata]
MSQLSSHEFSSIGQVDVNPTTNEHFVGPFYPSSDAIDEGETSSKPKCGPYQSTHVHFQSAIGAHQVDSATSTTVILALHLLRTFAGTRLPDPTFGAPFFLPHPDFGYQNILVDAEGNVTGIIDWDDVSVGPRQSAFARYPSWITRDWDPMVYGYREAAHSESDEADANDLSREAQKEVRQKRSRASETMEAFEIAISSSHTRAAILDKFTDYVYGGNGDDEVEWLSFITLSRRLSTGGWLRDTVGEKKSLEGGEGQPAEDVGGIGDEENIGDRDEMSSSRPGDPKFSWVFRLCQDKFYSGP